MYYYLHSLISRGCCCRFDRTISVDTPDIKGREQIFRVHLAKLRLEKALEHYSGVHSAAYANMGKRCV